MRNSKGFSLVEVMIVIVIVALLGFIGWRVWDATQNQPTTQPESSQTSPSSTDIKTDADLDKASERLDATNIESTESQDIESETTF